MGNQEKPKAKKAGFIEFLTDSNGAAKLLLFGVAMMLWAGVCVKFGWNKTGPNGEPDPRPLLLGWYLAPAVWHWVSRGVDRGDDT